MHPNCPRDERRIRFQASDLIEVSVGIRTQRYVSILWVGLMGVQGNGRYAPRPGKSERADVLDSKGCQRNVENISDSAPPGKTQEHIANENVAKRSRHHIHGESTSSTSVR